MKNRRFTPILIYVLMMILVFSWSSGFFGQNTGDIPYSEVISLLQKEQDLRRTQHTPALLQAARGIGEGYFSLTAKCFMQSAYHTMDNE